MAPANDFGASKEEFGSLVALLQASRPMIRRWALGQIGDPDEAEDVTQEVCLKAWRRRSAFMGTGKLEGWLYRITRNQAVEVHRRRTRERGHHETMRAHLVDRQAERARPEQVLEDTVEGLIRNVACALPSAEMQAFQLVDLGHLRPCEAARAAGKSQEALRSNLCRARKRLRELLAAHHPEICRGQAIPASTPPL